MIIARPDQRGECSWCARKFKQVENEPGGAMPFFWRWPINKPGQERGGALLSPPSQTLPPLSSGGSALAEPTEIEELGSCFPARESFCAAASHWMVFVQMGRANRAAGAGKLLISA